MEISLIVSAVITTGVAWYLLKPHLAAEITNGQRTDFESELNLRDQKERVIQVLKDLELDYATGKVTVEDYERTKAGLELEAAAVFEKLDAIRQE